MADAARTVAGRIVALIVVAELALLIAVSASRLAYPFDGGHYECNIFSAANLTAHLHNPYGYAMRPPYVMALYGYVYYWMVGIGSLVFGEHFWWGRLLSIAAAAVCLAQIFRVTRAVTNDRLAGLLAALAFASCAPFQLWVAVQRADIVALALSMSAIALVVASDERVRSPWIAGVLCAAAILCKETFVLPLLVVAAGYAQRREWNAVIRVLSAAGSLLAIAAVALNATSDGGYMWQHFTLMRNIPVSGPHARFLGLILLRTSATPVMLALIAVYAVARSRDRSTTGALLVAYFVAAVALGIFGTRRWGSNINYYLEAVAAASMLAGIGFRDLELWPKRLPQLRMLAVAAFALLGSYFLLRLAHGEYYHWRAVPYYRELVASLARHVPPDGICVSVYADLAIAAGRQHHFDDWVPYIDGRSPELDAFFRKTMNANPYAAMIWHGSPSTAGIHGFEPVPTTRPLPPGVYAAFLYVRSQSAANRDDARNLQGALR